MQINSINTNLAAFSAQSNIRTAQSATTTSVSRLSSGNKITQASDDVAGLSIGTSLATNVSTLRTALVNASQGISLLSVADSALNQITEILQRQKSIAVQAGSGTLGSTERAFLDAEFQALTSEIDRIAGNTNFNGVNLINGGLSTNATVDSNTTNADKSSMSISFAAAADFAAGETLILNGVTLTAAASPSGAGNFQHNTGSIAETLDNLVSYLNDVQNNATGNAPSAANKLLLSGATYSREGNSLVITSRSGGDLSQFFRVNTAAMGTSTGVVSGQGAERNTTTTALTIANIDTNVSSSSTSAIKFADVAISYDSVDVATVATGDTLRDIMNKVNANTSTTGVTAFITGTTNAYVLNFKSDNSAAAGVVANTGNAGITFTPATAATTQYLAGSSSTGLGVGSVTGSGSTGGSFSILTDQTQLKASSTISFPEIAAGDLTSSTNFGTARDITIEGQVFTFTQTAKTAKAATEITIGATLQETLDNAVETINAFAANNGGSAAVNYAMNRIEASREGNSIVISNRTTGNALDIAGGTLDIVATSKIAGTSVSSADLSNASNNTGIDTKGVMNDAFIGTISGFSGSYVSANKVDLSVTVGDVTYTVKNVTTNPTADTDVRFTSENGGYFDVKLRANQGVVVANSSDVKNMTQKLDAAFAGVTFSQARDVSSYQTSGNLLGSSVKYNTSDFSGVKLEGVSVTAPVGSNPNGSISFTINGEKYTTLNPSGTQLGAYSTTRFVSASDANVFLEFTAGATALSFATSEDAAALEAKLKTALGVTAGASSLSFQVGTNTSDSLNISIQDASSAELYEGKSLNVLTSESAAIAVSALDTAIQNVTSVRAQVGAIQSRFNFAAANIESSIQNQDAARGTLLDTDIADESTKYAIAQVKLQAGISVLAQANQQLQSLLKLIG